MWSLQYFVKYIRLGREVPPHKEGGLWTMFSKVVVTVCECEPVFDSLLVLVI
jgi:hypothetical protein